LRLEPPYTTFIRENALGISLLLAWERALLVALIALALIVTRSFKLAAAF
jgi:hypothetical protein